jgi:hypothetical protein
MARALKTSIAYFYEGLGEPGATEAATAAGERRAVHEFLLTPEGMELAAAFPRIRQARVRRRILDLARALAEEPEDGEPG